MFRLCSNDSSVLCRCPTPRRRARGPYGLSLLPPSCGSVAATGVSEVSRFSCLKFLDVSGVFDYAGLNRSSRYRACSCCLPRITKTSASGLHLFGAEYPPHLSSIYASLGPSRYQRKTRGRVDRYSFLVRLFHPLLQAGLARRTEMAILQQQPRSLLQTPKKLTAQSSSS